MKNDPDKLKTMLDVELNVADLVSVEHVGDQSVELVVSALLSKDYMREGKPVARIFYGDDAMWLVNNNVGPLKVVIPFTDVESRLDKRAVNRFRVLAVLVLLSIAGIWVDTKLSGYMFMVDKFMRVTTEVPSTDWLTTLDDL